MTRTWTLLVLILAPLTLSGCASMLAEKFANNLSIAILNHDDPETVRLGVPAYMIMLDSIVLESPNSPSLLHASASLHSAYASLFSKTPAQAKTLAVKAKAQSRKALCRRVKAICKKEEAPLDEFKKTLIWVDEDEIEYLYTYGSAWASWIQINKSDWSAVAQIPRVKAIMERVVELDETYEWGRAHLFLGVIHSQLPPALGGKPEIGLVHFNKAIEISGGTDQIAKVELARSYARLVFDQELHDKMLEEVIAANAYVDKLTLSNVLAKQEARELLATSAEYFEE